MNVEIGKCSIGTKILFRGDEDWEAHYQHLKQLGGVAETNNEVEFSDVALAEDWLHQILQKNQENITTLILRHYEFSNDGYGTLGEDLTKNTTLKQLDILFPAAHCADTTLLFDGIAINTSIEELHVSLPRSLSSTWKSLSKLLTLNKSIKRLKIIEIPLIEPEPREDVLVDLFNSLASNDVLTDLNLLKINFSAQELMALGEGLKHNRSLNVLNIVGNYRNIREHEIGPLGDALKHNKTIKKLTLLAIKLTEEHLQRLFDGLIGNHSITNLVWKVGLDCSMDPLLKYLRTTQTLSELDLTITKITEEIEQAIFPALAANTSITILKIAGSELRTTRIGSLLKDNKNIKVLQIYAKLEENSVQALKEALIVNKTLTSLDLRANVYLGYREIFKYNTTLKELYLPFLPYEELIEIVKNGKNLKRLVVDLIFVDTEEWNVKLDQAMEDNYTLTNCWIGGITNVKIKHICDRNFELQKLRYEDTAIIIHNFARSELFRQLPTEIWIAIFTEIDYPGLESFGPIAKSILKLYCN